MTKYSEIRSRFNLAELNCANELYCAILYTELSVVRLTGDAGVMKEASSDEMLAQNRIDHFVSVYLLKFRIFAPIVA